MAKLPHAPVLLSLFALVIGACARGGQREPLVPDETQRRSEERYGQQSQMMNSLNQTSAEQAAARHESATRPVERDDDEPARESRE